jgi:hypothetical protein
LAGFAPVFVCTIALAICAPHSKSRADVSSSLVVAIWCGSEPATGVSLGEDHHELSNRRTAEVLERHIDCELDLGFAAPGLTHQAQAHSHRVGFLVAVSSSAP